MYIQHTHCGNVSVAIINNNKHVRFDLYKYKILMHLDN